MGQEEWPAESDRIDLADIIFAKCKVKARLRLLPAVAAIGLALTRLDAESVSPDAELNDAAGSPPTGGASRPI